MFLTKFLTMFFSDYYDIVKPSVPNAVTYHHIFQSATCWWFTKLWTKSPRPHQYQHLYRWKNDLLWSYGLRIIWTYWRTAEVMAIGAILFLPRDPLYAAIDANFTGFRQISP